jgi:hypothetical protein
LPEYLKPDEGSTISPTLKPSNQKFIHKEQTELLVTIDFINLTLISYLGLIVLILFFYFQHCLSNTFLFLHFQEFHGVIAFAPKSLADILLIPTFITPTLLIAGVLKLNSLSLY